MLTTSLAAVTMTAGLLLSGASAASAAGTCTTTVDRYNTSGTTFVRLPANGTSTSCTMRSGTTGAGVRALQRSLNFCYGAGLGVDGSFGSATRSALIRAQGSAGVPADGVYGPVTRDAIRQAFYRVSGGAFFTCGYA